MLKLVLGKYGSGKTSYLFSRIAEDVKNQTPGTLLIVPEQYSHDAERIMAQTCGDEASLFAEVLSFSRLSSRVFAQTGGMAHKTLDKGGKILSMSLALSSVSSSLRVYSMTAGKPEFIEGLVAAYEELRSAGVTTVELMKISNNEEDGLLLKLSDLAIIFEAYEAVKEKSGRDALDRMEKLSRDIGKSDIGNNANIYIDGFTDFTAQELSVVGALMKKCAGITVALTCGGVYDDELLFKIPSHTARTLLAMASKNGVPAEIINKKGDDGGKAPELSFLEKNLFNYSAESYPEKCENIGIYAAEGIVRECECAADRARRLLLGGARMKDIQIVSPAWEKYAAVAGGIFKKYELNVNMTQMSDILQKPVMAFVIGALDIVSNNWDYLSVFKYLKTGLTDVSAGERDELENYVLKWNIRGWAMWNREADWKMPPEGWSEALSEDDENALLRINGMRRRISAPLYALETGLKEQGTAIGKIRTLYTFMESAGLYGLLNKKAAELYRRGDIRLCEEYKQLWDILVSSMEQFADILGDTPIETEEFIRLVKLVFSQYEVGTIPTSADGIGVGDMKRIRSRGIKHLIIIGASDDAMPRNGKSAGVFSDSERLRLVDLGINIMESADEDISRELNYIYSSLALPKESLAVSYPAFEGTGRRSYIIDRIEKLFNIKEQMPGREVLLSAKSPCFELAASYGEEDELSLAAREYFERLPVWRERLLAAKRASKVSPERLGRVTAERLYGKTLNLTASRVDMYYSCRYAYFLRFGLRAKPRREAALDAPETGTFMHFVLENVTRDAQSLGGFGKVTAKKLTEITERYVSEYAEKKLGGLEDKTGRFKYLFRRLSQNAVRIVLDMSEELSRSDFVPVDFELKFAPNGEMAPVEIAGEDSAVRIVGIVDRVDGWVKGDDLYLRVVDYKTGKKAFSLSDIWYGLGLQMLIYLFALQKQGKERYEKNIVPAGVLYAPARDVLISADRDLDDDELSAQRQKNLKRSGLLLDDPEVIEAMEHRGGGFLPVKFTKDGVPSGDSLANLEKLGKLSRHIDETIRKMAKELHDGAITADPYFRSQFDSACTYCDYFEACHIKDGAGEKSKFRKLSHLKTYDAWKKIEGENGE